MKNTFTNRVTTQRMILKQINSHKWPQEQLFALTSDSINRWVSKNQLNYNESIVKIVRDISSVLLFASTSSQEQVSEHYKSWKADISHLLNLIVEEMKLNYHTR